MGNWNLGSVSDYVTNLLGSSIPSSISGTVLLELIDKNRIFVEQQLGISIGSTSIPQSYQNVICKFSQSEILFLANPMGMNKSVRIGDISVNKSYNYNATSNPYYDSAMKELMELKGRYKFKKAFG